MPSLERVIRKVRTTNKESFDHRPKIPNPRTSEMMTCLPDLYLNDKQSIEKIKK